jgi:hypothetical protein
VVADRLESFLDQARHRGRTPPWFVERELRHFLKCGIFAYGFVRVYCDDCRADRLVPFSCKGRGFCSSCGGRRMADTAAHLVDRVLPRVPVRQWVLSLPYTLRYHMSLVLDGVFDPSDGMRFRTLPPPSTAELEKVTRSIAGGIYRLLERRGFGQNDDPVADAETRDESLLASLYADGRLLYGLRHPWRDGTTHAAFLPLELIEKLAALVPPPRVNLVRYHGVLAPAARHRAKVVPKRDTESPAPSTEANPLETETAKPDQRPRNYSWAELLHRVFAIDVLACPECGGRMRMLSAVHSPEAIRAILECFGLPARSPPVSPADPRFIVRSD